MASPENMLPFESEVLTLEKLRVILREALREQTEILCEEFKGFKGFTKNIGQREKGQRGEAEEEEKIFNNTESQSEPNEEKKDVLEVGVEMEISPRSQEIKEKKINITIGFDTLTDFSECDNDKFYCFGTMDNFMSSWEGIWQSAAETLLHFLNLDNDYNRLGRMEMKHFLDFVKGKIIKEKLQDFKYDMNLWRNFIFMDNG